MKDQDVRTLPRTKDDAVPAVVTRGGVSEKVVVWRNGVDGRNRPLVQSYPPVASYLYHYADAVHLES